MVSVKRPYPEIEMEEEVVNEVEGEQKSVTQSAKRLRFNDAEVETKEESSRSRRKISIPAHRCTPLQENFMYFHNDNSKSKGDSSM
uniref:Uncharacterized protein n=1 Tax=Trichogramma kaykai TaxID=54128 RepID=A0ABD2VXQ6_9HYME